MAFIRYISLSILLISLAASASYDPANAAERASSSGPVMFNPRGQVLALSCSGCHGTDGKSASAIPSIQGKSTEYLEAALLDFRSGARASTVMGRHARGYSDEEIHLIAEYFGNIGKRTTRHGGQQ